MRCDSGLEITATGAFDSVPRPDVILVPGSGRWQQALAEQNDLVAWPAAAHTSATWTTSVCTGSTLLAKAGILAGRPATTHWAVRGVLRDSARGSRSPASSSMVMSSPPQGSPPESTWRLCSPPGCGTSALRRPSSCPSSTCPSRRSTRAVWRPPARRPSRTWRGYSRRPDRRLPRPARACIVGRRDQPAATPHH
ncbi:MAG: DJ-1/PfpI family protein [Nocardiopsaceae bacterium]|nr:DJ-1/PfpI family protein [Nocardiopsaceae bacterium]